MKVTETDDDLAYQSVGVPNYVVNSLGYEMGSVIRRIYALCCQ